MLVLRPGRALHPSKCIPSVQSHSCFRAVPDRTARARGWPRLKQNKQTKPSDTQDAYPDQNCFSRTEKGQVPTSGVGAAATAPAAGTVLLPPPLPLSSVSLPHLLISVPRSLSHTLREWRGRVERALIYGLEVQSCPEYLPTSSLTSYKRE